VEAAQIQPRKTHLPEEYGGERIPSPDTLWSDWLQKLAKRTLFAMTVFSLLGLWPHQEIPFRQITKDLRNLAMFSLMDQRTELGIFLAQ